MAALFPNPKLIVKELLHVPKSCFLSKVSVCRFVAAAIVPLHLGSFHNVIHPLAKVVRACRRAIVKQSKPLALLIRQCGRRSGSVTRFRGSVIERGHFLGLDHHRAGHFLLGGLVALSDKRVAPIQLGKNPKDLSAAVEALSLDAVIGRAVGWNVVIGFLFDLRRLIVSMRVALDKVALGHGELTNGAVPEASAAGGANRVAADQDRAVDSRGRNVNVASACVVVVRDAARLAGDSQGCGSTSKRRYFDCSKAIVLLFVRQGRGSPHGVPSTGAADGLGNGRRSGPNGLAPQGLTHLESRESR